MYTTLIEVAYLVKEEPYSLLASYLPIVPTYQIFENRDRKNSHSWTTHCAVCSFVFSINSKIKSIFFFHNGDLWLFISRYDSYHLRLLYLLIFSVPKPVNFSKKILTGKSAVFWISVGWILSTNGDSSKPPEFGRRFFCLNYYSPNCNWAWLP